MHDPSKDALSIFFFCCFFFFKPKVDLLTKSLSQGPVGSNLGLTYGYKSSAERVYCIEFGLNGRAFSSYRRVPLRLNSHLIKHRPNGAQTSPGGELKCFVCLNLTAIFFSIIGGLRFECCLFSPAKLIEIICFLQNTWIWHI